MVHHGLDSLIVLLVGLVELDSFRPHLVLFACPYEFWDVQLVGVGSDEVHESLWLVLGEDDAELGVDAIVSSLKSLTLLQ